jgi:hypothetical protein
MANPFQHLRQNGFPVLYVPDGKTAHESQVVNEDVSPNFKIAVGGGFTGRSTTFDVGGKGPAVPGRSSGLSLI